MADKKTDIAPLAAKDDAMLESLFAVAKDAPEAQPSPDFMARVLAEAEALQPVAAELAAASAPRSGPLTRLVAMLGGWPSVSGLAVATMAGVWVGVAAGPAMMQSDLGASLLVTTDETYLTALDASFAFLGN
ncbi:hypothetical protein [Shimia sp. SK013]|uniref:hypothetical protein n=1 Tax=Shimia sp. SK013 TaxID=1389006 RepID=UPI0006B4B312|nr:hypothetical protein [Shimia sp. SK013]